VKIQGTTSTTKANINNYQHGQRNTILPTTTPKTYMKEYIYLERKHITDRLKTRRQQKRSKHDMQDNASKEVNDPKKERTKLSLGTIKWTEAETTPPTRRGTLMKHTSFRPDEIRACFRRILEPTSHSRMSKPRRKPIDGNTMRNS
jgi:hypothetical protein